ncbi:Uncharacterised protein [Vibrio cholerae]|nr:Uncharacterised protein [Vibrio cholerae]
MVCSQVCSSWCSSIRRFPKRVSGSNFAIKSSFSLAFCKSRVRLRTSSSSVSLSTEIASWALARIKTSVRFEANIRITSRSCEVKGERRIKLSAAIKAIGVPLSVSMVIAVQP